MKRKDIKALTEKSLTELQQLADEFSLKLAKARLEKKAGKLKNTALVKTLADDLARVKTIIRKKELKLKVESDTVAALVKKASKPVKRKKSGVNITK